MIRFLGYVILCAAFLTLHAHAAAQEKNAKAKTAETKASEETKDKATKKAGKTRDPMVGKTADGKTVYEGTRGGRYYLNAQGDKVYVKDFVGAKIVGKTADGRNIFESSKGGKFYYNEKGQKVYLKGK